MLKKQILLLSTSFFLLLAALIFSNLSFESIALAQTLANTTDPDKIERSKPNFLRPGADPWVIEFNGRYFWSQSANGAREIGLWESTSLDEPGEYKRIWEAPKEGMTSREVWAPEIHHINGRFYVFFAADDGKNENHRSYVLVSKSDDPYSEYDLFGPLYTGDDPNLKADNRWAIDSTYFEHNGSPYLIWSGWEKNEDVQYLYIAPLASNLTETAGARVKICNNDDYQWERVGGGWERETRGLNEGPEILRATNGRIFLTYSCGHSLLPTYKIGMLELVGTNPLDPNSWRKFPEPFFQSDEFQFGVGHASFIKDCEGKERCYYHAKVERKPSWKREVFWRYVDFDEDGTPRISYR